VAEGVPAVILGLVALRYLTDRPEVAEWLAPLTPRIGLLCSIYFLNTVATYGLFLFLPKILAEASAFRGFALSAITSIPFVFALAGMALIGRHSDRTGERKWHVAACGATAATGLVLAAVFQASVPLLVVSFTLSQVGQRSFQGVFWAILRLFLGGASAAAGIALINAVGNLGGRGRAAGGTGGGKGRFRGAVTCWRISRVRPLGAHAPTTQPGCRRGVRGVRRPIEAALAAA
jgi:MFS family permease